MNLVYFHKCISFNLTHHIKKKVNVFCVYPLDKPEIIKKLDGLTQKYAHYYPFLLFFHIMVSLLITSLLLVYVYTINTILLIPVILYNVCVFTAFDKCTKKKCSSMFALINV